LCRSSSIGADDALAYDLAASHWGLKFVQRKTLVQPLNQTSAQQTKFLLCLWQFGTTARRRIASGSYSGPRQRCSGNKSYLQGQGRASATREGCEERSARKCCASSRFRATFRVAGNPECYDCAWFSLTALSTVTCNLWL
jgi:hypothetical protein